MSKEDDDKRRKEIKEQYGDTAKQVPKYKPNRKQRRAQQSKRKD